MQGKGEVMWPKLVASKLIRKSSTGSFVANVPMAAEAFSDDNIVLSFRRFSSQLDDEEDTLKYKLFVSTWNVGGVSPSDEVNLEDWLDASNNPCDIYVLGFQEIVPLNLQNVLGASKSRITTKWNSLVRAAINKGSPTKNEEAAKGVDDQTKAKIFPVDDPDKFHEKYKCVVSKQMVGLFITIWIREGLRPFIRQPSVSCVGCGAMGCLGNKGSVSVRFFLHETSFCFVCCHLSSGGKRGDEVHRNSDAAEIVSRTRFPCSSSTSIPNKILDNDRIIWLGDLNYRLSTPESTTRSLIHQKDWTTLLENDQLKAELAEGRIFESWREGKINFPPTYKYYTNSDIYYGCDDDSDQAKIRAKKKRAPAWCDRILWHGKGLSQIVYNRGESSFSDHKPVKAIFTVEVEEFKYAKALENLFTSARFEAFKNFHDCEICTTCNLKQQKRDEKKLYSIKKKKID